ncbi:MAG TPA: amino acid adenylation domain-containing protein [Thermoanaerobaculia bacterium]|nr:amino acid adenylation domain-containing protein [Thermoanaerobaculia bacterium]
MSAGALVHSPLGFDLTVTSLLGPLVCGGTVNLLSQDHGAEALQVALEAAIEPYGLLKLTPSHLKFLEQTLSPAAAGRARILVVGGEALGGCDLDFWARHAPVVEVVNEFGPTETTVGCCVYRRLAGKLEPGPVPIGRPIHNAQLYVLDVALRLVPPGVPGELFIAGAGLARGYLGRPDLTAERFVPDPFCAGTGERLYRTGDLARYRSDGSLEFLGRLDHQVKVRGYRIELGEVESVLRSHPAVSEAVVLARGEGGERRLAAYVIPGAAVEGADLRSFLQSRLPEYMVPSHIVSLEALPLTANGKVDRRALPEPEAEAWTSAAQEPRGAVEELVASIWSEVLRRPSIGRHDSFFELGGHSLLATRVMSRLRVALGVELPLRVLFEQPTLAALSERIEQALRGGQVPTVPPIVPVPRSGALPVSFAQQRLWFLDQLEPGSAAYNIPAALRIRGSLDVHAMERTLNEVERRHEVLRTVFVAANGIPTQNVLPVTADSLRVVDLSAMPVERREATARALFATEAKRPFDLARGPLWRNTLVCLDRHEQLLLSTVHHIASDGWSTGLLVQEVGVLYRGFATGEPPVLRDLPLQYADFAAWQRQWLQGEVLEGELAYWRRQLAGMPPILSFPADRPRPAIPAHRGAVQTWHLPLPALEGVKTLARERGTTLFMVLLAGLQALLARLTGELDFGLGTPIAGRTHREIEGLIGFFVNTLVLRADLRRDPDFLELLARVRETALGAYAHQEIPFERLVGELAPVRSLVHAPFFQVLMVLQNAPTAGGVELPGVSWEMFQVEATVAKVDLTLGFSESRKGLVGTWAFDRDLFDATTVARWIGQFETLLLAAIAQPSVRFSELPLLGETQVHQLLVDWNDTAVERAAEPIHRCFEAWAGRVPRQIALVFGAEAWTYEELDRSANRLARALLRRGVASGDLVGVCLERSPEVIAALLAILKAGAAYVPIDPGYPRERIALLLDDAGISVLLTREELLERLPRTAANVLCLDTEEGEISRESAEPLPEGAGPDSLAYVIYTSGSTGRPKGVAVQHRAVLRLVRDRSYADFTGQTFLQLAPVSFDASTFEIWGPLLNGGKLVIMPPAPPSVEALESAIERHGVTMLWLSVGLFHQVIDNGSLGRFASVRHFLAGGDVLSATHVARALRQLPETRLLNSYGPTENTTFTCCHPIFPGAEGGASIPIGRPIAGTRVYLFDQQGLPVPLGATGELVAAGEGLALGYLGRPDLTAERFVPDPFGPPGSRSYRTGDLARYQPEGSLEFLGRIDNQLKVRGFRIEPGEVEAALSSHPGVREAAVVAASRRAGEKHLVAYVVPRGGDPDGRELRRWLEQRLPIFMIPTVFVTLPVLPLTPHGKVDRRALPEPGREPLQEDRAEPVSETERLLAGVWCEVLDLERVGLQDNFFELGGDSLLSIRVVARAAQAGCQISVQQIFEHQTLAELAAVAAGDGAAPPASPLIALQPDGTRPPLFLVHPAGGGVECYRALVEHLGLDQPVYGLRAEGLDARSTPGSIEEMAASYIAAVRAEWSRGPYRLAGWSLGGVVAFEMARQLDRQGEHVALLGLLDASPPKGSREMPDSGTLIAVLLRGVADEKGKESRLNSADLEGLTLDDQLGRALQELRHLDLIGSEIDLSWLRRYFDRFRSRIAALGSYKAEPYAGSVVLFRADEREREGDPAAGWEALAEGVSVCHVPGTHVTMVREPHVRELAEALRSSLEAADSPAVVAAKLPSLARRSQTEKSS